MNFDFKKFKKLCNNHGGLHDKTAGMLDLRNERDRRAFTDYMINNGVKYTSYGETDPFVYISNHGGWVYGSDDNFFPKTYTIQDFLLPEVNMDNVLEFLGGE